MRLFGHPVHVMLIHFPVALWPAHLVLHLFAAHLPAGVSGIAGFWLLATGTGFGCLAACCGAFDLFALWQQQDRRRLISGFTHALINGPVLAGFTLITALEYAHYPAIAHGSGFLAAEGVLVLAMFVGNYFGGAVVWAKE